MKTEELEITLTAQGDNQTGIMNSSTGRCQSAGSISPSPMANKGRWVYRSRGPGGTAEGFEWVIDLDIEKYFDTVNHDKLISILREQVNDSHTVHLIRKFLQAGVMDNGLVSSTTIGVPQGGPLSPILSNIYLDKFDKELEYRGLHFVRYADDCNIFVRTDVAAERVMKSVTSWLERKLFLKVSATKTKMKIKLVLKRKHAVSRPLAITFTKLNQIIRGWINYFRIGSMKLFIDKFGQWLRT